MEEKTFKQLNSEGNIDKKIKKVGLSYGIVFSKEDIEKYNLNYDDIVRLNEAKIIKKA